MRLPQISFGFYQRLSARERVLALITAGAGFLIVNLVALSWLMDGYQGLDHEFAESSQELRRVKALAGEQSMWTEREKWLKSKQPVLASRDRAGTDLLSQVQSIARAHQVLITSPQIKPPVSAAAASASAPDVQPVTVEIDTQSGWSDTVRFLATLQQPENFLVFDMASLRSNPSDPRQMKGHFLISKWYAPRAK